MWLFLKNSSLRRSSRERSELKELRQAERQVASRISWHKELLLRWSKEQQYLSLQIASLCLRPLPKDHSPAGPASLHSSARAQHCQSHSSLRSG